VLGSQAYARTRVGAQIEIRTDGWSNRQAYRPTRIETSRQTDGQSLKPRIQAEVSLVFALCQRLGLWQFLVQKRLNNIYLHPTERSARNNRTRSRIGYKAEALSPRIRSVIRLRATMSAHEEPWLGKYQIFY